MRQSLHRQCQLNLLPIGMNSLDKITIVGKVGHKGLILAQLTGPKGNKLRNDQDDRPSLTVKGQELLIILRQRHNRLMTTRIQEIKELHRQLPEMIRRYGLPLLRLPVDASQWPYSRVVVLAGHQLDCVDELGVGEDVGDGAWRGLCRGGVLGLHGWGL